MLLIEPGCETRPRVAASKSMHVSRVARSRRPPNELVIVAALAFAQGVRKAVGKAALALTTGQGPAVTSLRQGLRAYSFLGSRGA
jgi:hypothetical protein